MTSQGNTQIRRRPDGSIDTEFYLARGRMARSRQATDIVKFTARWVVNSWSMMTTAAARPSIPSRSTRAHTAT